MVRGRGKDGVCEKDEIIEWVEAAIVSGNHRTMSSVSRVTTGVRVEDRRGEGGEVR